VGVAGLTPHAGALANQGSSTHNHRHQASPGLVPRLSSIFEWGPFLLSGA
jgi:hypothetical protein